MSLGAGDTEAPGKMRMWQEEFDVPLAFQAAGCWLCLELDLKILSVRLPSGCNWLGSSSASHTERYQPSLSSYPLCTLFINICNHPLFKIVP